MNGLFRALNDLVGSDGGGDSHVAAHRNILSNAIRATDAPWASLAISQLRSYRQGLNRAVIDTTQSESRFSTNLIVAEIQQEFCPHLNFEWLYFTDAKRTPRLHERFPSKSRPINIKACSPSLMIEHVGQIPRIRSVVIFPEDWRFPSPKSIRQLDSWDVFFFVDRFRLRTETYSWPLLQNAVTESTFPNLRALLKRKPHELAERLCSDWLGPHERNHRSGTLPRVVTPTDDFRIFKKNRSAGAFEEMRADVNAILELHANVSDDDYERCVGEFITLERLFRYPVQHLVEKLAFEASKRLDYDSIGSQLLTRFLVNTGHLTFSDGKVGLGSQYLRGLEEYAALAETVQSEAIEIANKASGDEWKKKGAGRRHISNFVRNAAGYNATSRQFEIDQIFIDMAEAALGAWQTHPSKASNKDS